jgi:hypothetical protein
VGALVPVSKNFRARPKKTKNEELAAAATMNNHKINQSLASKTSQRWVEEALVPVRVVVREEAEVGSNSAFAPKLTKLKRVPLEGAAKYLERWHRATNIS